MRVLHHLRSPLAITAALSVGVLLLVCIVKIVDLLGVHPNAAVASAAAAVATSPEDNPEGATWQQEMTLLGIPTTPNPSATSSTDSIAMIGPMVQAELISEYAALSAQGIFSTSTAEMAADQIAPNVKAILTYKTFSLSDLTTTPDTSYNRMLQYRSDLRVSFAPLLKNTSAEFEIYGAYVESGDPKYLDELRAAAANYRDAADLTAAVTVPQNAVSYHIAILDAMEEFAAALDAMSSHADDPITSAALLRSYNHAEQDMFTSFNNLASYYGRTSQS